MALRGVSQPSSTEAKDITVGTTTVTGGTDGRVLYDNAGVLGEKTVTGTGSVVLATSPTLVSPLLGTPTSGVATNLTGTAAGLTAGTVTTNANLTGPITSSGNATSIASQTGTGTKFVVDTSPTLVTPILGVAAATSVNKVAITAPATSATLTIADGTTLTETTSTSIGKGQYLGTSTNDAATAGNIGEFVTSTSGSIALTSGNPANLTSVSLTAGDWDCSGSVKFTPDAPTTTTVLAGWISSTSATPPADDIGSGGEFVCRFSFAAGAAQTFPIGTIRFSLASTTTIYLSSTTTFAVSTMAAVGFIGCRRVR